MTTERLISPPPSIQRSSREWPAPTCAHMIGMARGQHRAGWAREWAEQLPRLDPHGYVANYARERLREHAGEAWCMLNFVGRVRSQVMGPR